MTNQVRTILVDVTAAILFGLAMALAVPQAHAEMIQLEDAERERVKTMLVKEMESLGIAADEARSRVDAMTPGEVSQLAGRLDSLPAGGAQSSSDTVLVVILILIAILIFL